MLCAFEIHRGHTAFNARHGHRFVFLYTHKHASWGNQVELFFSILHRQGLRDASFCSVEALRTAVLEFIAVWNRERVDRKSTRLNSSHIQKSRMPSSA